MNKIIGIILIGTLLSGCATSTVNIRANVDDANVIVDGKMLGPTPLESIELTNKASGQYTVIIEKEGYETYRGYLQKESKTGAVTAVVFGYIFCWLVVPALLLINLQYVEGPVPDHYFILEEKKD